MLQKNAATPRGVTSDDEAAMRIAVLRDAAFERCPRVPSRPHGIGPLLVYRFRNSHHNLARLFDDPPLLVTQMTRHSALLAPRFGQKSFAILWHELRNRYTSETGMRSSMKTYTDYLVIKTRERYEIRDITDEVARIVAASAVDDGMVLKRHAHYRKRLPQRSRAGLMVGSYDVARAAGACPKRITNITSRGNGFTMASLTVDFARRSLTA